MDSLQQELKRRRGEPAGTTPQESVPSATESQAATPLGSAEPTLQPPAGSRFEPQQPSAPERVEDEKQTRRRQERKER
jgi:hypothetical protein